MTEVVHRLVIGPAALITLLLTVTSDRVTRG